MFGGGLDQRQEIEAFIGEWIASPDPAPDRLVIAHAPFTGGPPAILDTQAAGKRRQRQAAAIAERFASAAQAHASATPGGGSQRYTVAAMAGPNVLAQRMISIEVMRPGGLGDYDGPGDAASIVKQTLRHSERMHQLVVRDREVSLNIMQQHTVMLAGEMAKMREMMSTQFVEQLRVTQELVDRKHEREIEIHREQQKDERFERLWVMLQALAPTVIARMTGATAVSRLFHSLEPQVRDAILAALSPEQLKDLSGLIALSAESKDGQREIESGVMAMLGISQQKAEAMLGNSQQKPEDDPAEPDPGPAAQEVECSP